MDDMVVALEAELRQHSTGPYDEPCERIFAKALLQDVEGAWFHNWRDQLVEENGDAKEAVDLMCHEEVPEAEQLGSC